MDAQPARIREDVRLPLFGSRSGAAALSPWARLYRLASHALPGGNRR
jgi:hypothetical protein